MESSLHRQLKSMLGAARVEVRGGGYRADALDEDGAWVEVQSGPLGPLRAKLTRLLPERRVRVVKPVVIERRIVRAARSGGSVSILSARRSPKRGQLWDLFDDLVGLVRVFPHANLRIDVLAVDIDEVRLPRRRWPGHAVIDRRLREVRASIRLERAADLWSLLPGRMEGPFTTRDLTGRFGLEIDQAQRVAYCLRHSGAVRAVGKRGRHVLYQPS